MRFYCTPTEAVPVGPKASLTYRGQPRESYTIKEAEQLTGWDALALVALHNAVYPPAKDEDDAWVSDWAEALFDPAVKERLAYFDARRGSLPRETFLIAIIDAWDSLGTDEKQREIIDALDVRFDGENHCFNTLDVNVKGRDDDA